ncbi:MAG TPA: SDR family NAD(P)-dependent oxidoreductase, partial [Pontiella sp.]|nr:SDR family NAD(P)-dependent oxidoreductase [Pontiella sp.]
MKAPRIDNRSVLVTGCSSGIGLATAEMLRSRGWKVFPTARKVEDLDMLEARGFSPLQLDITSSASIEATVDQLLLANQGRVGAVVNNAGFGMPG